VRLKGTEYKARFALALFVLALMLTIGLSLALYAQARRELAVQRRSQAKTEVALLAAVVTRDVAAISDALLREQLSRYGMDAAVAVFTTDGRPLARASTIERAPDWQQIFQIALVEGRPSPDGSSPPRTIEIGSLGFDIAEQFVPDAYLVLVAKPIGAEASPVTFYIFSYQIVTLIVGLALILLLVRWLFRPYRRMVEAARGSPVRAPSSRGESEFVVETFQALIDQLQAKERELASLHDLERRRAERSERFSERLISSIPSGLVSIDSGGMVTSANAQTMIIFGPAGRGVAPRMRGDSGHLHPIGIDFREFFRTAPKMVEMILECLTTGVAFRREEADVTDVDGFVRHLGLSISPIIDASGNLEGALCLMTDITEIIDLRERMKLQENLANLGEMAAGLAHEFKNSLAAIHGYIQLAEAQSASSPSADRRATLAGTLKEVRLLARLVTDFLNFARPQQLNVGHVATASLIDDCVNEIRPQLKAAGIEISVRGRFVDLAGDESMLRRAFVNLLRNAGEAIDSQAQDKAIEVVASVDPGHNARYAHIRIRDTGSGISSEDLPRIFIPFFTTKSRGYGIGLAIVQKIIVAHGGDVVVERSDSSGTIFHCRLPITAPNRV